MAISCGLAGDSPIAPLGECVGAAGGESVGVALGESVGAAWRECVGAAGASGRGRERNDRESGWVHHVTGRSSSEG